jgi:hypothetical protein
MSIKRKKPVPKPLRAYLARKPRLVCEYTEFGVLSYVVVGERHAAGRGWAKGLGKSPAGVPHQAKTPADKQQVTEPRPTLTFSGVEPLISWCRSCLTPPLGQFLDVIRRLCPEDDEIRPGEAYFDRLIVQSIDAKRGDDDGLIRDFVLVEPVPTSLPCLL